MIFPLTSTKITVSEMDLSQQGPFAGYNHSWVAAGLHIFV